MQSILSTIITNSIIAVIGIVTILLLWKLVTLTFELKSKSVKRVMQKGIEADAIILDLQLTGIQIGNQPQVAIQVQVQPDKTRNFVAEMKEPLSFADIHELHTGCHVKVKYNPHNHKEIVLLAI